MARALDDPETPLTYAVVFREYGLLLDDGGSSYLLISHCPFCGTALPGSLRDAWFDALDELGLEPDDPGVPPEMQSDTWWRCLEP